MALDPADSVTRELRFATRRGRPVTGCAKTAAERMRAYRARRAALAADRLAQSSEFPSPDAEIPDEWEIPAPGPAASRLSAVTKNLRRDLIDHVEQYQHHRYGNPFQRRCAFFSRHAALEALHRLGGLASPW